MVVTNSGSSTVPNAVVSDQLPSSVLTVTWTCAATAGSGCAASSGSGHINSAVTLSGGGHITFTIQGAVAASATGVLTNTAAVALPAGFTDPAPGNNTATDTTTIVSIPVTGERRLYLPVIFRNAP